MYGLFALLDIKALGRCLMLLIVLLQPKDLASVSCTCAELHMAAASNALWRPHLSASFPDHCVSGEDDLSIKSLYRQLVIEKRCREEERREARRRARAAHRPGWPHHGGPSPLLQPPLPGFTPGITGGDYDRLPFLSGAPGMGPMGGGFMRASEGMFGTSLGGARRAAGSWRLQ